MDQFEAAGLRFVGKDDSGTRMEIVELANHPFFVAAQVRPGRAAQRRSGFVRGVGRQCVGIRAAGRWRRPPRRPRTACLPTPHHRPPATQFHPEFKSRPMKPSPLFLGLVLAASGKLDHFLSGRATPVASPAKSGLRPLDTGTIAALTAAKLQL